MADETAAASEVLREFRKRLDNMQLAAPPFTPKQEGYALAMSRVMAALDDAAPREEGEIDVERRLRVKADFVLNEINALHRERGRMSRVTVADVAIVLLAAGLRPVETKDVSV